MRNLSEKHAAFKSIILLMLMMFTGIVANAQDKAAGKQKPFVFIQKTGYGENEEPATYLNDTKFIEPAIIVYENSNKQTPVTNRFYISYYITSGSENGTKGDIVTEKGKTWSVDPVTGTRVETRYGDVETGKTAGTVYVHVKAVPSDRYTDLFEEAESAYRITLNKVQAKSPIRIVPNFVTDETYKNNWYAAAGTTISLPNFKVEYVTKDNNDKELVLDITKRFTVTATVADESKDMAEVLTDYKYNSLEKGNAAMTATMIQTKSQTGTAKIKFSFTPLYQGAYEPIHDFTMDLNIVDEKVTPKLIFANDKEFAYTGMQDLSMQRPMVYDQFGNDLTPTVSYTDNSKPLWIAWSVAPLAEGKEIHTPNNYLDGKGIMQGEGCQPLPDNIIIFYNAGVSAYCVDNLNTGDIPFLKNVRRNEFVECNTSNRDAALQTCKIGSYSVNVYCQVYPKQHYNWETTPDYSKIYNSSEDSYKFEVKPRPVKIQLIPSAKDVKITKDTEITMENRFDVIGVYTPEIDDTKLGVKAGETYELRHNSDKQDFGCGYTIKFKKGEAVINNFPHDDELHHITVDEKGNKISDPDNYTGDAYEVYWSVKGYNTDKDWTLKFLKSGPVSITYSLYPYNIGYFEDGIGNTTINEEFEIQEKVTPIVKVNPDPVIIYTSDKEFPAQPNITVTDGFGEDIKSHYDLKIDDESIKKLKEAGIEIDANGNFTIKDKSLVKSDYADIKVIATPKEGQEDKYLPGETTFRIIVKEIGDQQRFSWAVYDKNGNSIGTGKDNIPTDDRVHGKLVFTGAGLVSGGYSIDAIPGLTVQFGKLSTATGTEATEEDPWAAKMSGTEDQNKIVVYGDPVVIDPATGLPTDGTFYILTPRTNGFLTLDAKFKAGNNIVLTDAKGKEKQTINVKTTEKKPMQFRYPIYANTTYYLYNEGDADSYEPLKVHGISFEPGFITLRNDMKPIEQATAYANGYVGALPSLTSDKTAVDEFVCYDIAGELNSASESISDYAEISKEYGTVTTKSKGTHSKFKGGKKAIDNYGDLELKENYMKVYAEVKSAYKGANIKKVPAYNLYIGDIPTYVMKNGYTPNVLERISTTNYPTHIRAFFGGWENAENRPYIKNNKINETNEDKIEMLVDSWKTSKMDSVGSNDRVIDNFSFASFGTQNASSETVNTKFAYDKDDEDQTYNVPCRGTYVQFEPNESGTIAVYIIQNGMVAYDGDPDNAKKSGMNKLKVNPVFITDETGTPVKLATWSHSLEGNNTDKYTEAVIRCSYEDLVNDCGSVTYDSKDHIEETILKNIGYIGTEAQAATIKKGDAQQIYDIAKVLDPDAVAGSKGYSVITKAYTRYSFRVKAGKSYFLFMNGSKLGNDGFAFMPDNWSPERTTAKVEATVVLDDKGTAEGSKDQFIGKEDKFDYYDKTVNVKLYHNFTADQWTALSLPFSVNDTQFRKVFGDDAWAISLDEVADKATVDGEAINNVALFTQHNYHWLVAGRPYFVRPGKDFKALEDAGRMYIEIDSVTFEHASYDAENNGTGFIAAKNLVKNKTNFNFTANYAPTAIKAGDYFIGTKNGEASLYRATKTMNMPGYRAFINNDSKNDARIGSFAFGDINEDGNKNTTGIDEVYEYYDNGMSKKLTGKKGVFSIDGAKVADNANDIDMLPAGVYIVNGQTIVK